MIPLRRWTILVHRYLGIALGLLFVVWFVSGIAMIYAGGMPGLPPDERLQLVRDAALTELYVSAPLGEVVMRTTRSNRSLAWIAAIPHWLYFTPLRVRNDLWNSVVLWTSGLGAVSALAGLILAITQYRVRYSGLMRWHYVTGVTFGVFALTWVFSGWLSMEPGDWAASRNSAIRVAETLSGGPLELSQFPNFDAQAWEASLSGRAIKEVELHRLQGEPYYSVRGVTPPLLVAAQPLRIRSDAFSLESILARVKRGYPGVGITDSRVLPEYDAYYYDRQRLAPLPVLRVKFEDPEQTWVYIDPGASRVVAQVTQRQRVQRWLYHGLHSLDFSFWYYDRPLWDIVVIGLCSGGALLSAIGVVIGFKRLRRWTWLGLQSR